MNAFEINKRREKIISIIQEYDSIKVSELVTLLHVSDETIRKDLKLLSQQGLVIKKFGVVFLNKENELPPVGMRISQSNLVKQEIANKALTLLPDKHITIGLDQGSTVATVAEQINKKDNDCTIMTSSLPALIALKDSQQEIYCPGGKYSLNDMSFQANYFKNFFEQLHLDYCFIGSSGVKNRRGICSTSLADAEMKRIMVENSDCSIAVLEKEKFEETSLIQAVGWDAIDYVVTNARQDDPLIKNIQQETNFVFL